jgi:hypothetical protein
LFVGYRRCFAAIVAARLPERFTRCCLGSVERLFVQQAVNRNRSAFVDNGDQ